MGEVRPVPLGDALAGLKNLRVLTLVRMHVSPASLPQVSGAKETQ